LPGFLLPGFLLPGFWGMPGRPPRQHSARHRLDGHHASTAHAIAWTATTPKPLNLIENSQVIDLKGKNIFGK